MSKTMITTVYDEVLHKLETIEINNIDTEVLFKSNILKATTLFKDSQNGELKITLINENPLHDELERVNNDQLSEEQYKKFYRLMISKHLLLSAQDIILYRILLSHFINNQVNGIASISLDIIHKKYRGKVYKYNKENGKYDSETLNAYINSFNKLLNIKVIINFGRSNLKVAKYYKFNEIFDISSPLLQVSEGITRDNIDKLEFKYKLGRIGEYFVNSKQYGQLLPKKLYSLRFNQIDTFNMSIYFIRMIVINKRWKKDIKINVSTLLSRIMKYNIKGYNTLFTYLQYITLLEPVKRDKKIKHIEAQLKYVLNTFKEEKIITDYKYNGKFQYKYIRDGEVSVIILVGKKGKGKL